MMADLLSSTFGGPRFVCSSSVPDAMVDGEIAVKAWARCKAPSFDQLDREGSPIKKTIKRLSPLSENESLALMTSQMPITSQMFSKASHDPRRH